MFYESYQSTSGIIALLLFQIFFLLPLKITLKLHPFEYPLLQAKFIFFMVKCHTYCSICILNIKMHLKQYNCCKFFLFVCFTDKGFECYAFYLIIHISPFFFQWTIFHSIGEGDYRGRGLRKFLEWCTCSVSYESITVIWEFICQNSLSYTFTIHTRYIHFSECMFYTPPPNKTRTLINFEP